MIILVCDFVGDEVWRRVCFLLKDLEIALKFLLKYVQKGRRLSEDGANKRKKKSRPKQNVHSRSKITWDPRRLRPIQPGR